MSVRRNCTCFSIYHFIMSNFQILTNKIYVDYGIRLEHIYGYQNTNNFGFSTSRLTQHRKLHSRIALERMLNRPNEMSTADQY